jgi:hypothetical protein
MLLILLVNLLYATSFKKSHTFVLVIKRNNNIMTELRLKSKIDRKKLISIVNFLKAWDVDAEIKTTSVEKNNKNHRKVTFTDFGLTMPMGYKFDREEANAR